MSHVSVTAASARESARHHDGKFGPQEFDRADGVDLESADSAGDGRRVGPVRFGRYETVEEKIAAMRGELDTAFAALDDDTEWTAYLDTMRQFHRYSPTNQMLIHLQSDGAATRVAGYRTWTKLGRQVRKGEKGMAIFAPITRRARPDDDTHERDDGDRRPPVRVVGWTTAAVFDVGQTDGDPLPDYDHDALAGEVPDGFAEDLTSAIERSGYTVSVENTGSAALGYTNPQSKLVVVDPRLSPAARAQCLAHELTHIEAGHVDRLDEYARVHGARGAMEVEADSIAYVLCRSAGMSAELPERTAKYLHSWSDGDTTVLRRSAETVSTVSKSILDSGSLRPRDDAGRPVETTP